MNGKSPPRSTAAAALPAIRALFAYGAVLWLLCVGLAWLSRQFAAETPGVERPVIEFVSLLTVAFVVYLLALRAAVQAGAQPQVSLVILVFAVAFRLLLLFSEPIQEVDVYRYVWDGQVAAHGVNPFRYSPLQVLQASPDAGGDHDLARLAKLRDSSPALQGILARVHFSELPTVYPPVSQAVFASAAATTPSGVRVTTHVIVMKAWVVGFDVAAILILAALLRLVGKPAGWILAYAWCPLVLKEIANSGHLDAIAVCLSMLAVYLAVRGCWLVNPPAGRDNSGRGFPMSLSGLAVLGLAVGAKLYPVVLAPLLVTITARRFGTLRAIAASLVFLVVSAAVCAPMLVRGRAHARDLAAEADPPAGSPPVLVSRAPSGRPAGERAAGLKAFLSRWKMNDSLFLILIENLTPHTETPPELRPWFLVIPQHWRVELNAHVAAALSHHLSADIQLSAAQIPFLVARSATAAVFVILAGCFCRRAYRANEPARMLESAFLTLAWFFLLLPTQNAWYWLWALPLVPFARSRAWLAMSGLLAAYYLRFWLGYHWPETPVPPTTYPGRLFFDYIVTWFEFGPWFAWLACSKIHRRITPTPARDAFPE